uniref:Protein kinase domain-containing protein n=1 Tax=Plectus sambesii TaxID=2011161 RepID=A0A914WLY5_9BILA
MEEEYTEHLIEDSEKEEDNISLKLTNNSVEYLKCDAHIQDKLEYEATGKNFEIELSALTVIKAIGKGHFSDVHMGILSLSTGKIPVAVKATKRKTGSVNEEESEDILKRQRQALRDELSIFAHLQSSSTGGHENVLKLLGAITTIKTDFCLLTEYCECGSMDRFLQEKWKNGDFEDELVVEGSENEQIWKV